MARRKKLPKYVSRHGVGYRSWGPGGRSGTKRWLPVRATPEEAHEDAIRARSGHALPRDSAGPLTLHGGADLLLGDLVDKVATGERREGTVRAYETNLPVLYAAFGEQTRLDRIDPPSIERFIAIRRETVSPNTIAKQLQTLGRIFRLAIRRGLVTSNPLDRVEPVGSVPPKQDRMERVEVVEAVDVIRELSPEDADLIWLLFVTGIRRTEAAAVVPAEDVDLTAGVFAVRQGKKRPRNYPIPEREDAAEFFERIQARGESLVAGVSIQRRAERVSRILQKWANKLEERRLHCHSLRHSLTSHLARCGVPEYLLSAALGHGARTITQRYVHEFGPELREALEWAWREGPRPNDRSASSST